MFILLFFSYARFECLERLVIKENGIKLGGTKLNGSEEWWWFIYMVRACVYAWSGNDGYFKDCNVIFIFFDGVVCFLFFFLSFFFHQHSFLVSFYFYCKSAYLMHAYAENRLIFLTLRILICLCLWSIKFLLIRWRTVSIFRDLQDLILLILFGPFGCAEKHGCAMNWF